MLAAEAYHIRMNRLAIFGAIFVMAIGASAQMHGTPASVTSFHGPTFSQSPGVGASVTSLGRGGFGINESLMERVLARVIAVPVYIPSYYTYPVETVYPAYPVAYSPYTIEQGVQPVMQAPAAYATSGVSSNDDRYGEHYLDARESRREQELESRVRDLEKRLQQPETQRADDRAAPPREEARASVPPATAPRESMEAATVLVLKTGERLEVHNYAIVGQTLWVLDERASMKVSLADLYLDATQKENRGRGVRFPSTDK